MFQGNKLTMLVLSNNNITEIPDNAFRNFGLTILGLFNNFITTIGKGAFAGVGSVPNNRGDIMLSNNLITRLSSDVFDGEASNIKELLISNNQVNAIERDFFDFMSNEFTFLASNNACVNGSFFSQTSASLTETLAECINNF